MESRGFYLRTAGILGALAVVLGAFGAHGLKSSLSPEMSGVYETAVRYHFYHTLAILAGAAFVSGLASGAWWRWACRAWLAGTVLFSGSLYLLAALNIKWLGVVTPVGGGVLIVGWLCLVMATGEVMGRSAPGPR